MCIRDRCGTVTSALGWGGQTGVAYFNITEEYDGTSWSSGGDLTQTKTNMGSMGSPTDALSFGGNTGLINSAETESYNGTAWELESELMVIRRALRGAGTSVGAALSFGGYTTALSVATEETSYPFGVKARVKSAATQGALDAATWYPTGGSGYYETQPYDVETPDGRWYRLEMTLSSSRSSGIEFASDIVASDTSTATSIEDITGLSTTITLVNTSHIVAYMSMQSSVGTNGRNGYFALNIDGVDSPVLTRYHGTKDAPGNVGITYRTVSTLAPGTYTIKGRWYTETGVTLTGTNINLVAIALEDVSGYQIASAYDTVASDTTTSATLEDVDGLTQSITLYGQSYLFGVMAVSTAVSAVRNTVVSGMTNTTETMTISRYHAGANQYGVACQIGRTNSMVTGLQTVKGVWSTTGGTATGAPFIMTIIGLETEESTAKTIVSAHIDDETGQTTTSTTITDITNFTTTITLNRSAKIFAAMSLQSSISRNNTNGYFAINIDGTDYDILGRSHGGANDEGAICVFACTASALSAGTYTVKGRWYTDAGTLTGENMSLVAIAAEAIDTPRVSEINQNYGEGC